MGSILSAIFGPLTDLIGKFVPDATVKLQLEEALKSQEFQSQLEQALTNAQEAQNPSLLVAGWRPMCGWICTFTLMLGALIKVLLPAILIILVAIFNISSDPINSVISQLNAIDISYFITMLTGMLGLSGLRTFEKVQGIQTDRLDN